MIKKGFYLPLLSLIFLGICVKSVFSSIIWIALVPLIIYIQNKNIKQIFISTFIAFFLFGIIHFYWILPFLVSNGGFSKISSYFVLAIFSIYVGLTYSIVFSLYGFLKKDSPTLKNIIQNSLIASSLFFLVDFINANIFKSLTWYQYSLEVFLANNIYYFQLASIIGSLGVVFILILVNYLVAQSILLKNVKIFLIAAAVFFSNLVFGYFVANSDNNNNNSKIVAVISGNVKATEKWKEKGDKIITQMLKLINEAKDFSPQLIVWPETALPWTYKPDDDILKAIAYILNGTSTQNLIGYITTANKSETQFYNSCYLINSEGKTIDVYHKNQLLTFFEEPFKSNSVVALNNSDNKIYVSGNDLTLINTNLGKAWVMICNESILPYYFKKPQNTFNLLIVMSNDAWFEGLSVIKYHYYLSKLKAIEYRKPLIISSNRGISAIVNEFGHEYVVSEAKYPARIIGKIETNDKKTFYARYPLFLPVVVFIFLTYAFFCKIYKLFIFKNLFCAIKKFLRKP